jgi:Cytochrome C oxidase subunit II, transmembrane domain
VFKASPSFEGITELHNQIMFYLVIILLGVSYMLSSILLNFNTNANKIVYKYANHGNKSQVTKKQEFSYPRGGRGIILLHRLVTIRNNVIDT